MLDLIYFMLNSTKYFKKFNLKYKIEKKELHIYLKTIQYTLCILHARLSFGFLQSRTFYINPSQKLAR